MQRNRIKNRIAAVLALTLASVALSSQAARITVACQGAPCKDGAKEWARKTGNEVAFADLPNDSTQALALLQQLLNNGSDRIDVMSVDIVWPGILSKHLVDLKPYAHGSEKDHFAGIVANNTVDGKLIAMPWFTDAGLLYYRKDLLEKYHFKVPQTWEEMTATARQIQDAERKASGDSKMWGYVFQGRAYEGLTCDALEWVVSHGGGQIVEKSGKISINNPGAAKALDDARGWIGTITPDGVLNYGEEEARGLFQAGNAVFMRNWPYAWSLAQAPDSVIKGKVGIAPLPKGGAQGRNAAALGGWNLAVSRYSRNQKLAADFVMYMTGPEAQKRNAIGQSLNPTIVSLYQDADVLKANPFMGDLRSVFTGAVGRPSTVTAAKYNQVSSAFFNVAHDVLSGKAKGAEALAQLDQQLNQLGRGGKW